MTINFAEFKVVTPDGQDFKFKDGDKELELHQSVGNIIWNTTEDIGLSDLANEIYVGNPIDATIGQIKDMQDLIKSAQLPAFFKREFIRFVDGVE